LTLIWAIMQCNLNTGMMVNKITEVTIFESPDGGRTVYAQAIPAVTTHSALARPWPTTGTGRTRASQKRWVDIFQARQHNPELDRLCEQVEILYELSKQSQ
jgi:hypothetical protein